MKPKTLIMAVPTMIAITIAFGALAFYVEEKKYQALAYKKELDKLQASIDEKRGLNRLIKEIARQSPNAPLAILYRSRNLNNLSADELQSLVSSPQSGALTTDELNAIRTLLKHD